MTKGKYAARAATKRATTETESAEAAYRRQIVRLTEERNEACAERDKARENWQKEVRILRAQLAEGTSARVEALTRELNRVRDERDEARNVHSTARDRWKNATDRIIAHMVEDHGMSPAAALDAALSVVIGQPKIVTVGTEKRVYEAFGEDVLMTLRKVRRQ